MAVSLNTAAALFCLLALSSTAARSIDEIISDAANRRPYKIDTTTDDGGKMGPKVFKTLTGEDMLDAPTDDDGSVLVELDMKFTLEQWRSIEDSRDESARGRFRRKAVSDPSKRWPGKTIPYTIQDTFDNTDRRKILESMEEWERHTCLRFKPRTNESNYVSIVNKTGCWCWVGMQGGAQELSLGDGCVYRMAVIHELAHALGFEHEHSRPDRDDYVTIMTENIQEKYKFAFRKYNTLDSHGIGYDYGSIMHYGQKSFSKNGNLTIITKDPEWQTRIGRFERLSNYDIRLARVIYDCGCVNKNTDCNGWAGLGYCEEGNRYQPYMLANCAKACYGC